MQRQLKGPVAQITTVVLAAAAAFHLWYVGVVGTLPVWLLHIAHLAFLVPPTFLLYPASAARSPRDRPSIFDCVLALTSAGVLLCGVADYQDLSTRIAMVTPVTLPEMILGAAAVLLVLEATRRVVGFAMCLIVLGAALYLAFGAGLPGQFGFRALPFSRVIETLSLSTSDGIFGQLTGISATELILFIIFGTFLVRAGISDWFAEVSTAFVGHWKGGTAKLTILYSALFGSVSGSPTADLYTVGSYTIPLMKKNGFSSSFAGGVAAAAAVGAQIMPPVMGASVFIMAALLSRSYASIAIAAVPAAFLFFLAKWTAVHFEAKRRDLPPLAQGEGVSKWRCMRRAYYMLPIISLVVALYLGYSPIMAAMVGTVTAFVLGFASRKTWFTPQRLLHTLAEGARFAIVVAIPCAAAGIVVSALTATGLGISLTGIIVGAAHGHLIVALILVALAAVVLGIGVPTTPAYVLIAVVAGPALTDLGVNSLAANLFVLYFAVLSSIHPPVGITAYAAASIAEAPPMRTGIKAFLIALPGFIVPFAFCYHPVLIFEGVGSSPYSFLVHFPLAVVSIYALSSAIWGFGFRSMGWFSRVVAAAAGFALIAPFIIANLIGCAVMLAMYGNQWRLCRASRYVSEQASPASPEDDRSREFDRNDSPVSPAVQGVTRQ